MAVSVHVVRHNKPEDGVDTVADSYAAAIDTIVGSAAKDEVQFRALMNRYENSRIWGSRRIAPGIGAIR